MIFFDIDDLYFIAFGNLVKKIVKVLKKIVEKVIE